MDSVKKILPDMLLLMLFPILLPLTLIGFFVGVLMIAFKAGLAHAKRFSCL